MTTWAVRNEQDRQRLHKVIDGRKIPFTASLAKGAPRTDHQNRLQHMWLMEAQQQGDMTAEEYRGLCKLKLGVPILRAENEDFREKYDRIIRPLDYEVKLEMMMVPLDFPVTRLMTTRQKTDYLNAMHDFLSGLGFKLTQPGGDGWEA